MSSFFLRLIGALMMLSALAVALSRAPDRPVETLVARWALPPSDFIEVKGQLVHLRDVGARGDAEPIVLIHGTGASLHTWEGWAERLAPRHRVITFDLPGFGLTGPFGGQYPSDDYRAETYARFVLDLLDALKVERFVIGGNSLGGEVAWRVASLAPQRTSRLILVDATGYKIKPEVLPPAFVAASVPVLSHLGDWLTPRSMVTATLEAVYGDPSKVTDLLVDRYFELSLREGNRRAFRLHLQQVTPGADLERLRSLALPTLILWGGRDRLVPKAAAERFKADIAGSRLLVFDSLGHVPQEEDPAATAATVEAFLNAPS